MEDYPGKLVEIDHVEPVPRRIRATIADEVVLDTRRARYLWETPNYPQYYIPLEDVNSGLLVDARDAEGSRGSTTVYGLHVGGVTRPAAARLFRISRIGEIEGTLRFEWRALDHWFEEDEEVIVHPRSPYVRVDAIRSTRTVRVELDGIVLAESASPVMVFETGLPTRYYLNRTEVDFDRLVPSDTVTSCPYKGTTTGYWSVRANGAVHPDLAWAYGSPMRELSPIAGLVAFYNEKLDIVLDGERLARPVTQFSK